MITIHGRETSSNVQAVMWTLAELELMHERLDVGGPFGGNDSAQFLAMNPMGLVPVFQEGELTLSESQAIIRYLGTKPNGASLWPRECEKRAVVDQWMEWAKVNVYPIFIYKVFWQLIRVGAKQRNHDLIAEGAGELKHLMQIADARLSKHKWLASDHFSLADISFGSNLYRYYELDFDRADTPALDAYYKRLCTRQAYQAHIMISFESMRVSDD